MSDNSDPSPDADAGADAALVVKGEMEMADFMSKWSLSEPVAEAYVDGAAQAMDWNSWGDCGHEPHG